MKIGLIGWYGHGNAGDERILHCLRRFFDGHGLFVTGGFSDAAKKVDCLNSCDYVLLGGGGLILRGLNRHVDLIRRIRPPLGCVGLGVETCHEDNADFVDVLKQKCEFILVRDPQSRELLANHFKVIVGPDLTFLYPYDVITPIESDGCGVNLRPWNAGDGWDPARAYEIIAQQFSSLRPLPFYCERGQESDADAIRLFFGPMDDTIALPNALQSCRYVIGMRFHSLVFACQMGIPFVSLSYQPKNERLCEALGMPHLSVDLSNTERLHDAIAALKNSYSEIRERLLLFREQAHEDITSTMTNIRGLVTSPRMTPVLGFSERTRTSSDLGSSATSCPVVSVVLPTYNHLPFLPKAIDSVLAQTYQDFELVVVNDGSTDGTREYLDGLRDPRIRVIHQENKRLPEALNAGFRAARGELLTWVSADNYCAPAFLEMLVGALKAHPKAGFAYSAHAQIDENDRVIRVLENQDVSRHRLVLGNAGLASFMYRRLCHDVVGWYDPQLEGAEDWDMWIRILERFEPVYIHQVLYYYRLHADSMTAKAKEKVVQASRQTVRKTTQFWPDRLDIEALYPTIALCRDKVTARWQAYFDLGTGMLQARFGEARWAIHMLEQALVLSPNTIEIIANLTVAYARVGRWETTAPLLRRLVAHAGDPEILRLCQTLVAICREGRQELTGRVPLLIRDKQSMEWFQLERQALKVFQPSRTLPQRSTETEPLVTVYTVTYNTERYIRRAIESVLAQDYPNIEYLIVDDGSTDNTRAIVASYKDPRIIYVHRDHKSFASGMNEAIRRARGTFTLGVDADDYIDSDYVRRMVDFAMKNPGYDYYYPHVMAHVDENDQLRSSCYRYASFSDGYEMLRLILEKGYGIVPNPGSLKRRCVFDKTGLFREVVNIEDFVYLTEHAPEIRFKLVPDSPLYYYRRVEGHGNTSKYESRHQVMAEAMYNMILANDPLVFFPDLRAVTDVVERQKRFLIRAAETMERHAECHKDRRGHHFKEYANKIRERAEEGSVCEKPSKTSVGGSGSARRLKIAILPHKNNISFMGEILARMRASHDVQVLDCNDWEGIQRALISSDVCWIEWATDFASRVTQWPRRCRTILRLHSFEAFVSGVRKIRWENVDDLVLVSPYIRDVLKDRVPNIETKVRTHVVPNCVDLNKFYFKNGPRGKKIAFVGALRPTKNIPFLLQCLREIRAADPEYTLHVAGEFFGEELHRSELKYYIEHMERQLGLRGSLAFYGHVQDVSRWLDDKDFILSTSLREGHPVNIIEGMAKGLKPVIHNFPGVACFYPGQWVFNTVQECRDIVLSANFDRRQYRAYVEHRWSVERILPQIDALLESAAGGCASVPIQCVVESTSSSQALPKVSIVLACRDAEQFLRECLDSILAQTMLDWELHVLDDGSTDGTRRIIEDYAARDARIRPYYFDDNRGPYIRRNLAIANARSDFIVIQDADDLMCPDKLERLYREITADDRLGVVGSFYRMFLDGHKDLEHCEDVTLATAHEEIVKAYRTEGVCDFCWHGSAIIRKRLFEELGPYDENPFASDSFWLAKVVEYACRSDEIRLKNISEFLTLRRMRTDSQTASLPSFDRRSRRAKFREYRRGKLLEVARALDSDPAADVKAALCQSVCNDFVAQYGHLFEQWRREPLTNDMMDRFAMRIFFQLSRGQFVRCVVTCKVVERLAEDLPRMMRCYDLARGLAYFIIKLYDQSRECLTREYDTHRTTVAREFCKRYVDHPDPRWTRADRIEIVRKAIFCCLQDLPTSPDADTAVTCRLDQGRATANLSLIVECGGDEAQCVQRLMHLNEQTSKDFEVIALTPDMSEKVLKELSGKVEFGLTVLVAKEGTNRWRQRNLAAARAHGSYLAFIGEQASPERDFVDAVLRECEKDSFDGLRGRLIASPGQTRRVDDDLGDDPIPAACDTDQLCVFRKEIFDRLGGFLESPLDRGAVLMSYRIGIGAQKGHWPMRYCPNVVARSTTGDRSISGAFNSYALENRFCIELLNQHGCLDAQEEYQVQAFFVFVESLYRLPGRTEDELCKQSLNNGLFFEKRSVPLSLAWAQKVLECRPESLMAGYLVGAAQATLGRLEQACPFFEAIIEPLEQLVAQGRLDRGQTEFADYANLVDCYRAVCTLLAQCYMKMGLSERVGSVYTRLLNNRNVKLPEAQRKTMTLVRDRLFHSSPAVPTEAAPLGAKPEFPDLESEPPHARSATCEEETVATTDSRTQVLAELERKYRAMPVLNQAKQTVAARLGELARRMGLTEKSKAFEHEALVIRNHIEFETARKSRPTICRHKPVVVDFNVTTRCNAGCIMCDHTPEGETLPLDRFKRIADELLPTAEEVFLIGGEVLLHPDFYEICEYAHRFGVGLRMTTNLHTLAGRRAEAIERFFTSLKVSLDAATKQTYEAIRTHLSFERLLENLSVLAQIKQRRRPLNLRLAFVAMRRNIAELPATVELASRYGFDSMEVSFVQVRRAMTLDDSLLFHREVANRYFDLARQRAGQLKLSLAIPNHFDLQRDPYLSPEAPTEGYKHCTRLWQGARVQPNGEIIPCCHLQGVCAGNAFEQTFEQIWNGPTYRDLREAIRSGSDKMPSRCKHCQKLAKYADSNDAMLHISPERMPELRQRLESSKPRKGEKAIAVAPVIAPRPKVTVITSCHNSEAFLAECLDSIQNQTLREWELFLIDDGSRDGTQRIINDYASRDSRIKAHHFDENKGPYVRRNFAIERANSDYIVIHDADDIMVPTKLQILYEAIHQDNRLAMVGSSYRTFLDQFRGLAYTECNDLPLEHEEIVARLRLWHHAVSHGSAIFRKAMFTQIGPYDENPFGSDTFWSVKLATYIDAGAPIRVKNVPEYLTLIRMHASSQTQVLTTLDSRNRRIRYRQYCECKLRKIKEQVRSVPGMDIARELRECKCADFLTRFKTNIVKWESEPVDGRRVDELLKRAVWLLNGKYYVSCVHVLNGVQSMDATIAQRVIGFELLRGVALYALDMKDRSKACLEREVEMHDNPAARAFLKDGFESRLPVDVAAWCRENAGRYPVTLTGVRPVAWRDDASRGRRHKTNPRDLERAGCER
jgi:radical SAM protein with 4Fe4S-binding SPASM domain